MKLFSIILITSLFFQSKIFCQDSLKTPSPEEYLLQLNIPSDWEVTRRIEGKDYTFSSYSPDNKLFIYYCQFMEDDESRPEAYLDTYTSQFGIENSKPTLVNREVNGERVTMYFTKGESDFLGDRYNILLLTTSVKNKNIIAYLVYPLGKDEKTEEQVKKIMLYQKEP